MPRGQIVVPVLLRRGAGLGVKVPPIIAGAYIWYSMSQSNGWGIDASKNNLLIDNGTGTGGARNGNVFAANHLNLAGGATVDVPLLVDYDTYQKTLITNNNGTETPLGDGDYSVAFISSGNNRASGVRFDAAMHSGTKYEMTFDATIIGEGTFTYVDTHDGSNFYPLDEPVVLVNGKNTFRSSNMNHQMDSFGIYPSNEVDITVEYRNVQIRAIATGDSYMSRYDVATKQFIFDVSTSLPPHTPRVKLTTPCSQYFSHTKEPTTAEKAQLNYNPNLLFNVWFNAFVLTDGFRRSDMVNFLPLSEGLGGGAFVQDLSEANPRLYAIDGYTDDVRTVLTRQSHGANILRTERNDAGRPTSVIINNRAKFHGAEAHIDTGVIVDGSITNFTMMIAFTNTRTQTLQYVADSTDNDGTRLHIHHRANDPINIFQVQIGEFISEIEFPVNNVMHAMVVVWDMTTKMLRMAVDGNPLGSEVPAVFDKPIGSEVILGASVGNTNGFDGYISEGIFAGSKLTEADWQNYWTSVRD